MPAAGGAWITRDIIRTAGTVFAGRFVPAASGPCFIGVDVERHRPLRILVDRTGMGEAVVEQYQDDHGRLRIEGLLLTSARRLDVATRLR